MENQSRLMFGLAAVLLALVALIVLARAPEEGEELEDADEGMDFTPLLAGVEAEGVARVLVQVGGEERILAQEAGDWRLLAPVQADADDVAVAALVEQVLRAEASGALGEDPAPFGLDAPRMRLTLELAGGTRHVVDVGRDAPVGGHTYLALDGGPPRASRGRFGAGLDAPVAELRAAELWRLPPEGVEALEIVGPDAVLRLERRAGDWWVQAALGGAPADTWRRASGAAVDGLLQQLAGLRATGFLDEADPAALDQPWSVTARVTGASMALRLGPAGDGWVATGPLQPRPVQVAAGWDEAVRGPVTAWWATDLLPLPREEGVRVALRLGARQGEARFVDFAWTPEDARRIPEALGAVQVDRAAGPAPEGEAWGEIQVEVPGQPARVLRLHQQLEGGGRVAVDEAGGPPFVIPAMEIGRLDGALD